jgi:hypothetical protein
VVGVGECDTAQVVDRAAGHPAPGRAAVVAGQDRPLPADRPGSPGQGEHAEQVLVCPDRLWPPRHTTVGGANHRTPLADRQAVTGIRYVYTIFGGMMMGLGGAHLSPAYTPGWTEGMTAGRGRIAVAPVIFSTWDPVRAVIGRLTR